MKRLLMVTYFFPPVGGIGVERTLKHARFLPDHGWQPVVVGPENPAYRVVDPSTLARIPDGIEIHRAKSLEPGHLRRIAARLAGRGRRAGPAASVPPTPPAEPRAGGGLRRAANGSWAFLVPKVFFPDDQVLWVPGAIRAGEEAHRRAPVDAVLSSSPPVSGHLAAGILARRLGVPWIADFRDPWIGNAFARRPPAPHRALQRRLERWIVRNADRVTFATARWRDRYAERYPTLADRFVHIPNGYDPDDLGGGDASRNMRANGPFRLIYAGTVYGERDIDLMLDGVALALQRDPDLTETLRVEFVGALSARNRELVERRGPALEPVVTFLGLRPRSEAIAMQRSADAGLILIADDPGREADVNAKLYEYIGLDLPVLAVAPPGETRDTLIELSWGVGVDPRPDAIADGLAAIMALPRPDRPADPDGRYDRRRLTGQLAGLLAEISP